MAGYLLSLIVIFSVILFVYGGWQSLIACYVGCGIGAILLLIGYAIFPK